jgi:drug/metabolite transporter (DMT)-like permease
VELRVALAVVVLLAYGSAIGRLPKLRAHWRRFLILGLVNSAIPFSLIENVGPTSTATVTFLVPVFGVLFGVLLLDEPFGLGTLAGLGIVLLSVALVTGIASRKGKPA